MFVVTLSKSRLRKISVGVMCCALVVCSALLGRYISTRTVTAAAGPISEIESAEDIQTWFTGYGLEVDGASITADKVKIPRSWDDSFSAFNTVVGQSGLDLAKYKGKTVEKWLALIPSQSTGDESCYGVLLVYKKKPVGAYLLSKPSGVVTGLKDVQAAMAAQQAEDTQMVSGEEFGGDWGERHDDELIEAEAQAEKQMMEESQMMMDSSQMMEAQQTSGEPDSMMASSDGMYLDLPMNAEGYPVE